MVHDAALAYAATRLPRHMVPTVAVGLDALPVTANGKIDRKALPEPDRAAFSAERAYLAPRTPSEELLAGLWADLLGLPRVGVEDDFFALGGHSLLAAQLVSRVRELFAVELPLRDVFERTTVAALAAQIDALAVSGVAARSALANCME